MHNSQYLTVTVHCDGRVAKVEPEHFVLDGSFDYVVWWCVNLPPHGRLEIRFDGGAAGPFALLETNGPYIVGSGNVGQKRDNKYRYEVRVEAPGFDCEGGGVVLNLVQKVSGPDHQIVCDPNTMGPPKCSNDGKP